MSAADVEKVIREEFSKAGVDPDLGVAIGKHESNLNPDAEALTGGDAARGGSYGAMQMSMMTARGLGFQGTAADLKDPRTNAALAAKHVAELARRFRDPRDLAAAYNSGLPYDYAPDTTRQSYVPGVMKHLAAGLEAPTAATEELGPVEPAVPEDLGPVEPATQPAALAPPAAPPDSALTAFQATHSGVNGDQAAQALKLAKATGFAPEMVAQNLETLQQRVDQTGFEDALGASPALAAYAAQGPIPASLIKDDVGPLEALEQGLLDVGYNIAATKEMTFPSAETEQNLLSAEGVTSAYEKRPSGIIARGIRDIPTLATYYGAGLLGKKIAGPAGELGANAGAMFLLNRGTLYRQIMQQMPYPETDEQGTIGIGAYDQVAYEKKARIYATVGAGASAVLATGISHAVGMALPAITTRVNGLSNGIITRAFTDPATRDVIANLIGKTVETEGGKVVTGAAGWGGHTLAGALAMAIPAVVDDATVQQAIRGQVDPGKAAAAGWEAFKSGLVAAGVLSALPHVVPTVRDMGRAAMAPFDAARLDHNVEQIQAAKLTTRHPEEAEKLVGRMTDKSDADTVFVSPEAMADPKLAAKVADAAGPHAMGDAQVTGGDVAVPAEKYLVRLNGDHAALRENVKTLEDGATPKEAAGIPTPDTLTSLMAQRSWILQTEPTATPERTAKLADIETRMRAASARGMGTGGAGRVATEEEMKQAAADYAQMKPPGQKQPTASADWSAGILHEKHGMQWDYPEWAQKENPEKAYRGVTSEEWGSIQTTRAVKSTQAFSAAGEGTSFAGSPDTALSYVQTGRDNPAKTGRPVYVLETDRSKVKVDPRDYYLKAQEAVPLENVTRAWRFNPDGTVDDVIGGKAAATSAAPAPAYEVPPPPNVTPDDEAMAREHIEGKTIGEIRPSYYETQGRRAGDRLTKLASGPDTESERIFGKYAEALGVSLDSLRNAVQGTFSADTLPQARRKLRTAETEANRLEAGRMETLQKLEAEHAMNVANRQASIIDEVRNQKNAKLFAGVAREVRAEMDRTEAKLLKKAGDADFLAMLQRAGPEYRDAHDAIFSAVFGGPEAPPQPGAIDPLIDRLQRDGLPLGFDPDHIRALLADPLQWKDLTPAEARNVADAVDNIRTAAKTVNSIALGDRRQALRDFVDGVRAHLDAGGVPDKGLPAPSEAGVGRFDKIKEGASALSAELLRPETILGRLGPDGEKLFDTFVKSRNQKEEYARQIGDFFTKAYEQDLPKALKKSRLDGVTGPTSPVVADDKWVRQDLWTLAGWYGSESGADRLRLGLRISDEQIRTAISQLTKPEAELIDSLHALHDEKLFPLIRDHEVANTGASPPKIEGRPFTITLVDGEQHTFRGGYWPAKYRGKGAPEVSEPASIEDYWGALKNGFPSTSKSFTKERVTRFEGLPDLNWSSYAGHINSVLHYLSYDDFVRNTGKVFQDPEFRDIVQRRLGDQEMRELDKFVGVAARGKVEAPTDGAAKWGAMVGGGFRSRVAIGAFQLNLPVVLGQLSHIPAMMAGLRIGLGDMLQGLGKAFIPSSWDADHAESQQLPYRWNGYGSHMREMLSSVGPGDKPLGRKWLDAVGWSLYHTMDGFISKIIYGAAKAKAQSNWFSGEGLTGQAAIDYADRALSRAMPPLNIAEQSSIVRDRGLIGSLLLVRNFPNTLYNVGAVNAWQAKTGAWAADPGWQRTMAKLGGTTAAAASYLGMVWGAHIFGRFLMGHGRQEDESTSDWLEREALAAPFYPIPIAGDVAAPVSEAIVSPTKTLQQTIRHGLHAAPVIAMLEGSIRDFSKAVGENGTDTDKAFAAAKLAATALRLPVYPLRPARYTLDLFSGEASPRGPWDVMGGLLYGQRDRQARNPATTIQDVASGEFQ